MAQTVTQIYDQSKPDGIYYIWLNTVSYTHLDIYYLDWNVSSGDATGKKVKAQTLVDNVLTGVGKHQTSVVLLHDAANKNTTVEALPAIIEEIQAMDDTVLLPVSDDMEFVQHLKLQQSTAQQ